MIIPWEVDRNWWNLLVEVSKVRKQLRNCQLSRWTPHWIIELSITMYYLSMRWLDGLSGPDIIFQKGGGKLHFFALIRAQNILSNWWYVSINCTFLDSFGKKVWKSSRSLYLQLTYKKLKKCFAEFYTSFYNCNNKANKITSKNVYQKVHITKVMIRIIISYIEIIGSIPKFPQTLRGAFSYGNWLEIHENSMSSFWYFICIFEKIRFNNNT